MKQKLIKIKVDMNCNMLGKTTENYQRHNKYSKGKTVWNEENFR